MKMQPARDSLSGHLIEHPAGYDHTPWQFYVALDRIERATCSGYAPGASDQRATGRRCKRQCVFRRLAQAEIAIAALRVRDRAVSKGVAIRVDGYSRQRPASACLSHRPFNQTTGLGSMLKGRTVNGVGVAVAFGVGLGDSLKIKPLVGHDQYRTAGDGGMYRSDPNPP